MLNQNQKLNEWEERETRALATEYVDLLVGGYTTYTEPLKFKIEAREINNELALFGYLIDANEYKPIPVNVYFGSYANMEEVEIKKVLIEEELRKQCHEYIDTLIDYNKTDFKDIEELMDWYNDIMSMFDEYYQVDFVTPTLC